jgi:hypothetical protein
MNDFVLFHVPITQSLSSLVLTRLSKLTASLATLCKFIGFEVCIPGINTQYGKQLG